MSIYFPLEGILRFKVSQEFANIEAEMRFAGAQLDRLPEEQKITCTRIIQEYLDNEPNDIDWSAEDEKRFSNFVRVVLPFFALVVGNWDNHEREEFALHLTSYIYRQNIFYK